MAFLCSIACARKISNALLYCRTEGIGLPTSLSPLGGSIAPHLNNMSTMSNQPVYKIIFHNGKQIFEVYAKHIYQSDMWGFGTEEMLFGERSAILVDPGEEAQVRVFRCEAKLHPNAIDHPH